MAAKDTSSEAVATDEKDFEGFPGYGAPRFTMIPDVLLDQQLPELGHAELKVLLVIMRKTYGWQKDADRISLNQLAELTGIARRSVIRATQDLERRGYILVERNEAARGEAAVNLYRLRIRKPG